MLTQAICDAKLFMFDPDAELMPREALTALQTSRLQADAAACLRGCATLSKQVGRRRSSSRAIQVTRRYRPLSLHVQI